MKIDFLPVEEKHLEVIRRWRNSEEVKKYMYTNDDITPEQQVLWFKNISRKTDEKHWVIACDNELVGVINLKNIDLLHKNAEWAFYLGDVVAGSKGIGPLTEYEFLEYAFNEHKFHKLNCGVITFNSRVIKLHKHFGFKEEGIMREQKYKDGRFVDIVLLGITANEWAQQKDKLIGVISALRE